MNAIRPLAVTDETVTLRRTDFETMLQALEDNEDQSALRAVEAREHEIGKAIARAHHLPVEAVIRLMGGEHPLRVWREHLGLTASALAENAGIARSYLVEIEKGRKPGSMSAYRRLAKALDLTVDDLMPAETEEAPGR